jgi:hypothetical protein
VRLACEGNKKACRADAKRKLEMPDDQEKSERLSFFDTCEKPVLEKDSRVEFAGS